MVVKPYTITEFEAFLAENGDKLYELIDGQIIEKMPTELHGLIAGKIITYIGMYLLNNEIGRVGPEIRYQVPDDLHNSRLADVAFRLKTDKPIVTQGAVPGMPDLAVEVQSPNDTLKSLREKARYYLANGSQMVWVILTDKRLIEVYTAERETILTKDDTLTGEPLLPGFEVAVSAIFEV